MPRGYKRIKIPKGEVPKDMTPTVAKKIINHSLSYLASNTGLQSSMIDVYLFLERLDHEYKVE